MANENGLWWIAFLLFIFSVGFIAAMISRNHSAKKDSIGKSEKNSTDSSVAINPREKTDKLD